MNWKINCPLNLWCQKWFIRRTEHLDNSDPLPPQTNTVRLFWHQLILRWSLSISVITTFFEVFRLCIKFVNKIRCTENYLEIHETNDIFENPINQGLIWNLFWCMSSREILGDMHLNLARSTFWDFFTKYFWTLRNGVKIIILETCFMII